MYQMQVHYPEHKYSIITGHSLGGILAKMAASIVGDAQKVLAFNSPGVQAALNVVPLSIIRHLKKVETIVTYGDDVGNYHKSHDIGPYIEISNIASSSGTRAAANFAIGSSGAIAGATAGAIVGSTIFPGVGTVAGAVIGAAGVAVGGTLWLGLKEHQMTGVIKAMGDDSKHTFNREF